MLLVSNCRRSKSRGRFKISIKKEIIDKLNLHAEKVRNKVDKLETLDLRLAVNLATAECFTDCGRRESRTTADGRGCPVSAMIDTHLLQ